MADTARRRAHNRRLALDLAEAGIPVFPSDGKVPLIPGWPKLDSSLSHDDRDKVVRDWRSRLNRSDDPPHIGCTTDKATIRRLWGTFPDAVPSISLGPAKLYVLDADIDETRHGPTLIRDWLHQNGVDISQCPVTRSQSGGEHIFFANPTDTPSRVPQPFREAYTQAKGVRNQVVAPGAWRVDGKKYLPLNDTPGLRSAFAMGTLPPLPERIDTIVRQAREASQVDESNAVSTDVDEYLFDPELGSFDANALCQKDAQFKDAWNGEIDDKSDCLFHIMRGLRREYGGDFRDDHALSAVLTSPSGLAYTGHTPKSESGEFSHRDLTRAFHKAASEFPDTSQKIPDGAALALDGDDGVHPADKALDGALIRYSDFKAQHNPRRNVLGHFLQTGYSYTLTARTGHGKTLFLVAASLAVALGRTDIVPTDKTIERGKVIYFTFENPDDMRAKLVAAAIAHGADETLLHENLIVVTAHLTPKQKLKLLKKFGEAITLIVIDTFQAAFTGEDFNDNKQVLDFARALRPLAKLHGDPAILMATHPVKNAAPDNLVPYGGGALVNELDGNLTLWKDDEQSTTTLHHQGKFRGNPFSPIPFEIVARPCDAIPDYYGEPEMLPFVRPVTDTRADEIQQEATITNINVLKALVDEPNGSLRTWAKTLGMKSHETVRKQLQGHKARGNVSNPAEGKWIITPKGKTTLAQLDGLLTSKGDAFGAVEDDVA